MEEQQQLLDHHRQDHQAQAHKQQQQQQEEEVVDQQHRQQVQEQQQQQQQQQEEEEVGQHPQRQQRQQRQQQHQQHLAPPLYHDHGHGHGHDHQEDHFPQRQSQENHNLHLRYGSRKHLRSLEQQQQEEESLLLDDLAEENDAVLAEEAADAASAAADADAGGESTSAEASTETDTAETEDDDDGQGYCLFPQTLIDNFQALPYENTKAVEWMHTVPPRYGKPSDVMILINARSSSSSSSTSIVQEDDGSNNNSTTSTSSGSGITSVVSTETQSPTPSPTRIPDVIAQAISQVSDNKIQVSQTESDYIKGLLASSITMFVFFLGWSLTLLATKLCCCRRRRRRRRRRRPRTKDKKLVDDDTKKKFDDDGGDMGKKNDDDGLENDDLDDGPKNDYSNNNSVWSVLAGEPLWIETEPPELSEEEKRLKKEEKKRRRMRQQQRGQHGQHGQQEQQSKQSKQSQTMLYHYQYSRNASSSMAFNLPPQDNDDERNNKANQHDRTFTSTDDDDDEEDNELDNSSSYDDDDDSVWEDWYSRYRKLEWWLNVMRAVVVLACLSIIVSAIVMSIEGTAALKSSLGQARSSIEIVDGLAEDATTILDKVIFQNEQIANELVDLLKAANNMCPAIWPDGICELPPPLVYEEQGQGNETATVTEESTTATDSDLSLLRSCDFTEFTRFIGIDDSFNQYLDLVLDHFALGEESGIVKQIQDAREGLEVARQYTQQADDTAAQFDWALWSATIFSLVLAVLVLVLLSSLLFRCFRRDDDENDEGENQIGADNGRIKADETRVPTNTPPAQTAATTTTTPSKPSSCCTTRHLLHCVQSKFVMPLLVVLVSLSYIFSLVFVTASIATADMCVNESTTSNIDTRVLTLLDRFEDTLSPVVVEFASFYIQQCPPTAIPQDVMEQLDYVLAGVPLIQQFSAIVEETTDLIDGFCQLPEDDTAATVEDANANGNSNNNNFLDGLDLESVETGSRAQNLVRLAQRVEVQLCDIAEILKTVRQFFQCDRWFPLYETAMYEAVCTDGTDAFAYVASTQFVIVFMAFIILTFRVAFWDIQIGNDDDRDAGEGNDQRQESRDVSKMAVAVDSPMKSSTTSSQPATPSTSASSPPTSPFSSATFSSLDEKRRETQRLQDRVRASRKRQEEIGTVADGTGGVLPSPSSLLQSRTAISIPFDERDSYQEGYFEEYYKNEGLLSNDGDETDLSANSTTTSTGDGDGDHQRRERSLDSSPSSLDDNDDDDDDDDDFISYQSSNNNNHNELIAPYLDGNGCGGLVGEMVGIEVEHISSTADAWSLWARQLWGGNNTNRRRSGGRNNRHGGGGGIGANDHIGYDSRKSSEYQSSVDE